MRHRFSYFSNHALQRIKQRTLLEPNEIADIIDFGLAINTGKEIIFEKTHWLIYSIKDECYFFIIQDKFTGLVITLLPTQYHDNLAWSVDNESFAQAKSNIEQNDISEKQLEFSKQFNIETTQNIKVKIRYLDLNNEAKTKTLFNLPAIEYNYDSYNVPIDNSFKNNINQHLRTYEIKESSVFAVLLSYKKNDPPRILTW
ncbi:hypothetical protein FGD67_21145 [Colwellia sp. M166]|uniref:hypothetical protein n=1 Tax=Colwellia sp. M166 TaxID=2583805 RepID=UPI00211DDB30|nr:hypothetical protein [Colwellia sp. M166]UUO25441.1 hypothetical protein FGD67_21145 [Colwellia sp. M166]